MYRMMVKVCPECEALLKEYTEDGYDLDENEEPICPCCGYKFEYETEYCDN